MEILVIPILIIDTRKEDLGIKAELEEATAYLPISDISHIRQAHDDKLGPGIFNGENTGIHMKNGDYLESPLHIDRIRPFVYPDALNEFIIIENK